MEAARKEFDNAVADDQGHVGKDPRSPGSMEMPKPIGDVPNPLDEPPDDAREIIGKDADTVLGEEDAEADAEAEAQEPEPPK